MSLNRLIFWSGMLGGWSAFFGWLVTEILWGHWANTSYLGSILMSAGISMFIGGALSLVGVISNPRLLEIVKRLGPGLLCGLVGGFIGSGLGSGLYFLVGQFGGTAATVARVFGWVAMGTCLGMAEGLYERSSKKAWKGAFGGVLGGFVGGVCFNPISNAVGSPMSSRAFAFVVLGLMIGFFVGLVQVVLKDAWLTVEKGFRPGRQLLLGQQPVTMGTSEKAGLIFIAVGAKGVEPMHVKVSPATNGSYVVEDQASRSGTFVNGQRVAGPVVLNNRDVIRFGINEVRFSERVGTGVSRPGFDAPSAPRPSAPRPSVPASERPAPANSASANSAPAPPPKREPAAELKSRASGVATSADSSRTPPKPRQNPCPVCGCVVEGIVGKRRCPSCFTMF